jgi:hypothetical protein
MSDMGGLTMKRFLDVFRHTSLIDFIHGLMAGAAFVGLLAAVWVAVP